MMPSLVHLCTFKLDFNIKRGAGQIILGRERGEEYLEHTIPDAMP